MILLWIAVPLIPVITAVLLYAFVIRPRWPRILDGDAAKFSNVIVAVILFIVLLIPSIRQIDRHVSASACRGYAANAARETRFFENGYWDYDCYVHTTVGWVKRGDVVGFQQDNG